MPKKNEGMFPPSVKLAKMMWESAPDKEQFFISEEVLEKHLAWIDRLISGKYSEAEEIEKVMEGCRERWSRKFKVHRLEKNIKR